MPLNSTSFPTKALMSPAPSAVVLTAIVVTFSPSCSLELVSSFFSCHHIAVPPRVDNLSLLFHRSRDAVWKIFGQKEYGHEYVEATSVPLYLVNCTIQTNL